MKAIGEASNPGRVAATPRGGREAESRAGYNSVGNGLRSWKPA